MDTLRGLTLFSMILYHGVWDIVYIYGQNWEWFRTDTAYIWQQSICWVFILLSGFCWSLGRKRLKRALMVFGAGALVSLVTAIFTPQQRVMFGVLTLLGSCMLLMIPLDRILRKVPPIIGLCANSILFFLLRNINHGYLGFGSVNLLKLPEGLYDMGNVMTFLGFTDKHFYSTDYFALLPWAFLFGAGYYLYQAVVSYGFLDSPILGGNRKEGAFAPFALLGKHSLLIYLLHQPVIYIGLSLVFRA